MFGPGPLFRNLKLPGRQRTVVINFKAENPQKSAIKTELYID